MELRKFESIPLAKVGHELVTVGIVLQSEGLGGEFDSTVVMFPQQSALGRGGVCFPTVEQWQQLLEQMDFLGREVEVVEQDGTIGKAILRKSQRQIDPIIQWRVFKRDGFRCCYCGRDDVPLTVDHLVLWEERGPSIEDNLLSSCKKDNRVRGRLAYGAWLQSEHYKRVAEGLTPARRAANDALLFTLKDIPLVKRQRSR